MTRARCCCCGLRTHWPLRARKHARGTSRAASRPSHVARRVFYVVLTQPVRFRRWRRTRPLSAARVDPTALPRQVAPAPCNETCGNCAAWPRAAPRGHALGLLRLACRAGAVRVSCAKVTRRRSCNVRRRRDAPADRRGHGARQTRPQLRCDLRSVHRTCMPAPCVRNPHVTSPLAFTHMSPQLARAHQSRVRARLRSHFHSQAESVPDGIHTWHAVRAAYDAGLQAGRRVRRAAAARCVAAGRALCSRRGCCRAAARALALQPPRRGPDSAESRQPARARSGGYSAEHARCDRLCRC